MLHLWSVMVRRKGRLDSPVGYVKENLAAPQPQLPSGYQRLSSDPLPFGKEIDLDSSPIHPALPERDSLLFVLNQPLVGKSVDSVLPLANLSVSEKSGDHTAHVLLVSSDSHESKSDPPVPVVQESPSPILVQNGGNNMIPPPSSFVVSFGWGPLTVGKLWVPYSLCLSPRICWLSTEGLVSPWGSFRSSLLLLEERLSI